jgi:hypothetical protein
VRLPLAVVRGLGSLVSDAMQRIHEARNQRDFIEFAEEVRELLNAGPTMRCERVYLVHGHHGPKVELVVVHNEDTVKSVVLEPNGIVVRRPAGNVIPINRSVELPCDVEPR